MNIRQLSYFLKVYESGSIKGTAEELFITPQALSKTIISLEDELNDKLFIRNNNILVPTNRAHAVAKSARNILNEIDDITNSSGFDSEVLKISTTVFIVENFMNIIGYGFWKRFNEQHPHTLLNLARKTESYIIENLRIDAVEMAIVNRPPDPTIYESHLLCSQKYVAVINKNNPLSKKENITYKDLHNERIITYGREYPFVVETSKNLKKNNIQLNTILETNNPEWSIQAAEDGLAIGIVLEAVGDSVDSDLVTVVPQSDSLTLDYYLVYKKNKELSLDSKYLKDYILDYFRYQPRK